jgi:hypothetical protein
VSFLCAFSGTKREGWVRGCEEGVRVRALRFCTGAVGASHEFGGARSHR